MCEGMGGYRYVGGCGCLRILEDTDAPGHGRIMKGKAWKDTDM